mgnify:CR=1 FL=1
MRAAKWLMRAIIALAVCAILGITVTSAVLGYKAGREIKEEKKASAKSSYEEKTVDIKDLFDNVSIQAAKDMAVDLQSSADGKCHVHYYDSDEVIHSIYVEDNTLVITCEDDRTFGSDIGFGEDPYVTIEIPARQYDKIELVSESGQISASQSIRCNTLDVTEKSGSMYLVNVTADTVQLASESGDVSLATINVRNLYYEGNSGNLSTLWQTTSDSALVMESLKATICLQTAHRPTNQRKVTYLWRAVTARHLCLIQSRVIYMQRFYHQSR